MEALNAHISFISHAWNVYMSLFDLWLNLEFGLFDHSMVEFCTWPCA